MKIELIDADMDMMIRISEYYRLIRISEYDKYSDTYEIWCVIYTIMNEYIADYKHHIIRDDLTDIKAQYGEEIEL